MPQSMTGTGSSTNPEKPAKRKAGFSAIDSAERKRAQNRISQQCTREKNAAYVRDLENTVQLLQEVATSDGDSNGDRYTVLLNAHLKLIEENRHLVDTVLRLRKKLLSISSAATAAADDESLQDILHRPGNEPGQEPVSSKAVAPDPHGDFAIQPPEHENERPGQLVMALVGTSEDHIDGAALDTLFLADNDVASNANFLAWTAPDQPQHSTAAAPAPSTVSLPDDVRPAVVVPPAAYMFTTPVMQMRAPLPSRDTITVASITLLGTKLLNACRQYIQNHSAWGAGRVSDDVRRDLVAGGTRFVARCMGLEAYFDSVGVTRYFESVLSWRLGFTAREGVPLPFRPTPLQSRQATHAWAIDVFNWSDIRDQLVLDRQSFGDLDALARDLILYSVVEQPQLGVAVNMLDLFMTHGLQPGRAAGAQQVPDETLPVSPAKNYATDPDWILFKVGPESRVLADARRRGGNCDPLEAAVLSEVERHVRHHKAESAAREADRHVTGKWRTPQQSFPVHLPGVNDLGQWRLSKTFADKHPWLDCSSVVAHGNTVPASFLLGCR